jgi:hypothetical protein
MDKDTLKAIQVLALQSVEDPTYEDFYRSVCRWFSKEFSTPLTEVQEMGDEYVLSHYYETMYAEVKDATGEQSAENYNALKASILLNEHEKTATEMDDEQWAKELNDELAKQTEKAMSSAMAEIDEHIKTVQQGGETFEGFIDDDADDEDEDGH